MSAGGELQIVDELLKQTTAWTRERHRAEVLDLAAPGAELRARLARVEEEDRRAEGRKGTFVILGLLSLGGGVLLTPVLLDVLQPLWPALVSAGAGGGGFVVSLIGYSRSAARDLDDRKVALPRYLLEVLAPELAPNRAARVWVDFKATDRGRPLEDDAGSDWRDGRRFWVHEWLRLELPLLDGTRVRVAVSTRLKRKQRRKRKYTQCKDRRTDEVEVDVRPPPSSPPVAEAAIAELPARFGDVPLQRLHGVSVRGRAVRFRFRFGPVRPVRRQMWHPQTLPGLVDGRKLLAAVQFAYKGAAFAATRSA